MAPYIRGYARRHSQKIISKTPMQCVSELNQLSTSAKLHFKKTTPVVEAVEGEAVGVVEGVCASVGGSAEEDDVIAVELPGAVLEARQ